NKQETLVEALRGQDALVITLGNRTPKETDLALINAAGEAGVKWILPNEWGPDNTREDIVRDLFIFKEKGGIRSAIETLGKSSHISVATGFWYEWSVGITSAFGFDFDKRSVTLFDEGTTKVAVSTWPQVGRTVAAILSLSQPDLDSLKNKVIYVNSFTVNQRDMLDSVLRVTGTKEEDWQITKEPSTKRYTDGMAEMKQGDQNGFAKMLYSRIFYPDGNGDFEKSKGVVNELLGLPKEDIDEATKIGIRRSKENPWP
ncbi:hypothetical protein Golomagni_06376, partial [Golovinomyces magnicellulatus]